MNEAKQLPFLAAIASLSYVFWVVCGMEMWERLAYYGVKTVATLYAKDPVSKGGLGITMTTFGTLLAVWALVQSAVPVFTGGLSDRYGYKLTIGASTVIKILGYLTMAAFPTYPGFFAGAMLLAVGTGIFKPGIQGTLVKSTLPSASSMAWGIFYQVVNIGGFLGPLVAGYMRKLEWRFVFLACAAIISLNFFMLLLYNEPGKEERLARTEKEKGTPRESLWHQSVTELKKPHVWAYLIICSGFWFMFNSLFDVLPAHIEEWVDTRDIVRTLFGDHGATNPVIRFFVVMNKTGTEIQPEGMLNLNSGIIMTTCFLAAWVSGLMRATTAMVVGIIFASAALFLSGYSTLGWVSLGGIAIFSTGEMMSSPKSSELIAQFAPSDKKAMYLGFSQIPHAIGWFAEGKLGPWLYDHLASKERFAREMLLEHGWTVTTIKDGEAFDALVKLLRQPAHDVTHLLYLRHAHSIGWVWYIMGGVGLLSAIGVWLYGRWLTRMRAETHVLSPQNVQQMLDEAKIDTLASSVPSRTQLKRIKRARRAIALKKGGKRRWRKVR